MITGTRQLQGTCQPQNGPSRGQQALRHMGRYLHRTLGQPYLNPVPIWAIGAEPQKQMPGLDAQELAPPRHLGLECAQRSRGCLPDPLCPHVWVASKADGQVSVLFLVAQTLRSLGTVSQVGRSRQPASPEGPPWISLPACLPACHRVIQSSVQFRGPDRQAAHPPI